MQHIHYVSWLLLLSFFRWATPICNDTGVPSAVLPEKHPVYRCEVIRFASTCLGPLLNTGQTLLCSVNPKND